MTRKLRISFLFLSFPFFLCCHWFHFSLYFSCATPRDSGRMSIHIWLTIHVIWFPSVSAHCAKGFLKISTASDKKSISQISPLKLFPLWRTVRNEFCPEQQVKQVPHFLNRSFPSIHALRHRELSRDRDRWKIQISNATARAAPSGMVKSLMIGNTCRTKTSKWTG